MILVVSKIASPKTSNSGVEIHTGMTLGVGSLMEIFSLYAGWRLLCEGVNGNEAGEQKLK